MARGDKDVLKVTSEPQDRVYRLDQTWQMPIVRTRTHWQRTSLDIGINMGVDLPSVADLKQAVEAGQRITPGDVSAISQAESELTGRGPLRGGPAGE